MSTTDEIGAFFESYREAFSAWDPERVVEHYTFPAQIVGQADAPRIVCLDSAAALVDVVRSVLARYEQVGCKSAAINSLETEALSAHIARAQLNWGLLDVNGKELFNFDTLYTVVQWASAWKIASVVAYNEVPRIQAFLEQSAK